MPEGMGKHRDSNSRVWDFLVYLVVPVSLVYLVVLVFLVALVSLVFQVRKDKLAGKRQIAGYKRILLLARKQEWG